MMSTLDMSPHARQRRKQMGVTEDQIAQALTDPHTVYPGARKYGPGRTCYQRDNIVVVTASATGRVITILWHRREGR